MSTEHTKIDRWEGIALCIAGALLAVSLMLIVQGCASMAWRVECDHTSLRDLDRRFTDELYDLHVSELCRAPHGGDEFTECPAFHSLWRRYWAARRELDQCPAAGTVRS